MLQDCVKTLIYSTCDKPQGELLRLPF